MAATSQAARPFQVIVYGATGFTGKLVCQHIAKDYQGRISWAMAGRDAKKLEQVRADLVKINSDCKDVPIMVADAYDGTAMGNILSQTKVVLAMAGPYSVYGDKVVEQSIEQGTHYCDITGEVPWVKKSIQKHNKKAQEKGVKVVHCCGYDSLPSDLGTLMMVDYIKKKLNKKTDHVYTLVAVGKGGFSGGTVASVKATIASEGLSELSKVGSNAYYLAEVAGGHGTAKPSPSRPTFNELANSWTAPFFMEPVNGRIVQLSNALAKEHYGSDFKYTEMIKTGQGWAGWAAANAVCVAMGVLGAVFAISPLRALSSYVLPAPGQGPSVQMQQEGHWTHELIGVTEEAPGQKPTIVRGRAGDRRDPGYWSTSRMILEAGLCLALDSDKLDKTDCLKAGVMTGSTAMGLTLVERLRAAGQTWEVPVDK